MRMFRAGLNPPAGPRLGPRAVRLTTLLPSRTAEQNHKPKQGGWKQPLSLLDFFFIIILVFRVHAIIVSPRV